MRLVDRQPGDLGLQAVLVVTEITVRGQQQRGQRRHTGDTGQHPGNEVPAVEVLFVEEAFECLPQPRYQADIPRTRECVHGRRDRLIVGRALLQPMRDHGLKRCTVVDHHATLPHRPSRQVREGKRYNPSRARPAASRVVSLRVPARWAAA
ncbi:hypothetical protein [Dactylosporangium sp. CA-092794]|uniref:hypothetical protein n=1 Tax=Dactylosporangium sp. CA-092794 TaxID=3239929 RepID=UPI003D8DF645